MRIATYELLGRTVTSRRLVAQAAGGATRSEARTLPSRPITHVGYVVDDIDRAVSRAVDNPGACPFFLIEHLQFETCTFNGSPAHYDHSSAFGQWS